uniref:Papilin-like n=1 Tax=Paramormyrops kingsleyae TaxID=1676925 RepID=A0A3B3QJJ2_9TELE|nr:papilin-like [Paramormyrops kingsleyae]
MRILLALAVLQVIPGPSLQLGVLSRVSSALAYESWGSWGPCSRSCGTGVTKRTRQCNVQRQDGRNNCVGAAKDHRACNTQECPVGSRDFREEQCSQFDGTDYDGKFYTWLPYYGAANPCELNCIPRGENFFFRHRPTVVDGTPCYPGRRDICVEGVCQTQLIIQESRFGEENNRYPPPGSQRVAVTWSSGRWSACSTECGPGYQSRHVFCTSNGLAVAEHLCSAMARPPTNRTCEVRECSRTYMYEPGQWSPCSASCGVGVQTRQVPCVIHDKAGGQVVQDALCARYTARPATRQDCQMPPCPDDRYMVYSPERTKVSVVSAVLDPLGAIGSTHCSQSYYGCCSDGKTEAGGLYGEGCPSDLCSRSRYGCCPDGMTAAQGPSREGCLKKDVYTDVDLSEPRGESKGDCHTSTYGCCPDQVTWALGSRGEGCHSRVKADQQTICSLPRSPGSCSNWSSRYHYDPATGTCSHFWYGGCHGNSNNFPTREECQRQCDGIRGSRASPVPVYEMGRVRTDQKGPASSVRGSGRRVKMATILRRSSPTYPVLG